MLRAAKVSVFFIDDAQMVRPNEIGSIKYIKDTATKFQCRVLEFELEAQFRCGGSGGFVNWINNTLGVQKTANVLWDTKESFEFRIFDTPWNLENAIKERQALTNTGRMTAGFCWGWSDQNTDGTLKEDVMIGDFTRPWNAKPDAAKLALGIPKSSLWAYDPNGLNQIGCVYTAQGFEFDYVGVIIGKDIVYNLDKQQWEGNKVHSYDTVFKRSKDKFEDLIKNTYRVLLTRGMKGCYVYFEDKDTERFFKSRME
ncbi:MAG TPA: DNA/RNA helicase domain-containing protein [Bacilli bacterium]